MKKILVIVVIIIIAVIGYKVSTNSSDLPENINEGLATSTESVSTTLTGTYSVSTSTSNAAWTGSKKLVVNYFDHGTIAVKSGEVTLANGMLTGGKVTLDMNSIATVSTGSGSGQDSLTKHLKSPDFFDTVQFPESTYVVASSTKQSDGSYVLHGALTIKGKTGPLDIPATVGMKDGSVVVSGEAKVDRSKWDVRYGSETFFQNLGNNVIDNIFTLKFSLIANTK